MTSKETNKNIIALKVVSSNVELTPHCCLIIGCVIDKIVLHNRGKNRTDNIRSNLHTGQYASSISSDHSQGLYIGFLSQNKDNKYAI